ncbi:MAG TPA: histidine phosphatase family protein [Rhizomicrobium sp.]|nr:histidine phosphatase family protein [Rhizomicrobium sp.]
MKLAAPAAAANHEFRDIAPVAPAVAAPGAVGEVAGRAARPLRIVLIRHGQPAIDPAPVTGRHGFRHYIDAYEASGLDPASAPPEELQDLVAEIGNVFTSGRKRADESARALAPGAELTVNPLFAEAPLASPPIPLLKMKVTKWAVVSRVLWYAGFNPRIENYRRARRRAAAAADILIDRARRDGTAVLVAHGYFNYLIGAMLRRRGFRQTGSHKARYWNDVVYERADSGP